MGAVFCAVGIILIGTSFINRSKPSAIRTISDIRAAYNDDALKTSLYSAGVAILASGLLVFFGFGITSFIANKEEFRDGAGSAEGALLPRHEQMH